MADSGSASGGASARGSVLFTLASAQFLMTLDSSVMNVSIATVAKDVGTTVTGIQVAITLYTLVMAAFMITGGKIGQILGRKRTFMIGCVVYGCGVAMTALSPHPPRSCWSDGRFSRDSVRRSSCRRSSRSWRRTSGRPSVPARTAL